MHFLRYTFFLFVISICSCSTPNRPANQDTASVLLPVPPQSKPATTTIKCKEAVYQILTSSSRFKDLTKNLYGAVVQNGGSSYGVDLEGSPHPEQDSAMQYSATYDFALHETYPDRDVTVARFTFNPSARQLYEYDAVLDSLMPVAFDKALLSKLNGCK